MTNDEGLQKIGVVLAPAVLPTDGHADADYYAFILGAFGAADFEADTCTGTVRCGIALKRLYGFPDDLPLTLADVRARYHPDDLPQMLAVWTDARDLGQCRWEREYRIVIPEGQVGAGVRWVLARGEVLLGPDGVPERVRGAAFDITERKRVEDVLRKAEDRYQALFNSIDQGFCTIKVAFDATHTPIDYRFLDVSPSFERQTGIANGLGRWMREIAPDQDDFWFEVYGHVAVTGEPTRFEYFSTPLGRWWSVYAFRVDDPQLRHVGVLFNDITARKRADEHLTAAAARDQFRVRLTDALRAQADPVVIQGEAARVLGAQLGANRVAYFEVQGTDYVVEHDYVAGVPPIVGRFPIASFGPTLLASLRAGRTVVMPDTAADPTLHTTVRAAYAALQIGAFVAVALAKDGHFVAGLTVHMVEPRTWTQDEITLIEETAERTWDAVERAGAEARRQQLYAQEQAARKEAEEASRLKDEFLATVSHELRTPLTALLGFAELLQRRAHDEAYVRRTVAKMLHSAQAQATLIEDLLDVSRIVSGKLGIEVEPIALIDVIHAALDTVQPTLEVKRLEVELDLDPAANVVLGDANRLQQVVWNLLANAAKFTPAGGRIALRLAPDGSHAELAVHDTGQGIRAEFLPYVFDRFRQADSSSQRAFGGLGLGLAIVRHLVELHGGTVAATSAGVGLGATFTVRLPRVIEHELAGGAASAAGVAALDGEPVPLHGLRVLVVDDQPPILELLEELLTAEGATVQACSTAQDALARLRMWQPDVLVSDIAMPEEDGYWLIGQVRRLGPEAGGAIPAVALTAYVRLEDRLQVVAAGFQQYVMKPVNAAELRDVILHLAVTKHER